MPIRILALLALLVALVVSGCGGDDGPSSESGGTATESAEPAGEALSSDDYIEEINSAQTTFAAAASELNLADPDSPDAFADSIEQLGTSVDGLVSELDAIEPPEEIADLHQQLIDGMTEYNTTLEDNLEGLRSDDSEEVQTAAVAIGTASSEFSENFSSLVTQINTKLGSG